MDVEAWLTELGLEQYAEAFAGNEIDGEILPSLTGDDLKEIGVGPLGHRKKLLAAIAELAADLPSATEVSSAVSTGERRQVTVLFADIAGYTKLSSKLDAEEIHALLNRYFEAVDSIVERYGGRIDKHIGDNAMAVFGAPVAHDDDPLRAVRAALDIHERMATLMADGNVPLQAHIGIASGQVVASGTGSDTHREYTVTGDSVNLASRLEAQAAPCETLISNALHNAVAADVDCEPLGEVEVRGLDAPVSVWRVAGLRETTDRVARVAFVGRRSEIGQFTGVVEACQATGAGQAVVVRGEAGIGKTRLVEEFLRVAAERGFADHCGLVLDFGVGKGQDAIRAVVRSLLGLARGGDKIQRQAAVDKAIDDGLITTDRRVFLNDLLDLAQPVADSAMYDAMNNAVRNEGKRAVVADLLRAASASGPILVIIEDVHWAGSLLLEHLAAMARTAADCPALIVMTSRIEGDPLDQAWRAATGGCPLMTIDLVPLRRDEALTLAGAFVDTISQFAQDCIERAAGNPLFLEQLLRNAEERGDEEVPASIQSLVLARMDRLSPIDKRALQAASVLGQRFTLDVLRRLLDDADYDCAGLLAHHLVRPEGDDYLFAHALIRDGVYSSLLKATRQAFHTAAAGWFADYDLALRAEHLDRADHQDAPLAFLEAAKGQAALYRYDSAIALVERGRKLATGTKDAFALTALHGQFLNDAGMASESLAAYRSALELAGDDIERCTALIGIAAGLRLSTEYTEALTVLDQAEPLAEQHELTLDLARLHHLRGNLNFALGNVDACGEAHGKGLAFARRAGSAEAEARSLGGMGDATYASGKMASAHRHFSDCVALCRQQGFGRIEVANLAMAGWTLYFLNDLHGALDTALAAVDSSKKVGDRRTELNAIAVAVSIMYELGNMAHAPAMIERQSELTGILRAQAWMPYVGYNMAFVHELAGRHRQAIDEMERAAALACETSVGFLAPSLLGYFAAITDDPVARKDALNEGEAMLREGSLSHNFFRFYRGAMDACLKSGDSDEVDRYAAALEDYTRPEPLPWSDFFIARGRALAAHGRGIRDEGTMQALKRLTDEATRIGMKPALPALDAALATVQS